MRVARRLSAYSLSPADAGLSKGRGLKELRASVRVLSISVPWDELADLRALARAERNLEPELVAVVHDVADLPPEDQADVAAYLNVVLAEMEGQRA